MEGMSLAERWQRRHARTITAHISPYAGGLAAETRRFVAELNAEAERHRAPIKYEGLANRIEATGDIETAARQATLGGWLLRRAIKNGYTPRKVDAKASELIESEAAVLRPGNSTWRKTLRRRAKTKHHRDEAWHRAYEAAYKDEARRIIRAGRHWYAESVPPDNVIVPPLWPHYERRGGIPIPRAIPHGHCSLSARLRAAEFREQVLAWAKFKEEARTLLPRL